MLRERHRDRREDAARDREEVRREDEVRVGAERLERRAHLAQVPVNVAGAVGAEVLGDLAEEQVVARREAGTGDAAGRAHARGG